MKKKTRFDFNKLIDLYKEDLPNGRIYLYENLNVFLMYTWIRLYDYAHRKMEDVIHDAYMFIDAHIIKSIDKWFVYSQIYQYIKLRLFWFLMNLELKKEHMWYIDDGLLDIGIWYDFDADVVENSYKMNIIKESIQELDEVDRQIILLKYFWDGIIKPKDIAKAYWIQTSTIWMRHKAAIESMQEIIFKNKWYNDEKICND